MSGTLLLSSGPQRNIIRRKPPPVYFPSPPPRTSSLRTPIAFRSVPRMNLHKRLPEVHAFSISGYARVFSPRTRSIAQLPFDIGLDTTRDCGEDSDATLVNERHRPSRLGHRARTSIVRSSTIATPETLKTVDQSQVMHILSGYLLTCLSTTPRYLPQTHHQTAAAAGQM